MKKQNAQIKKLAKEALEALNRLEEAKAIYKELDRVTEEVLKSGADLKEFGIVLVDNFQDKNKVFKPAAVARFELKKVV